MNRVLNILRKKKISQAEKEEAIRLVIGLEHERDRWRELYGKELKK